MSTNPFNDSANLIDWDSGNQEASHSTSADPYGDGYANEHGYANGNTNDHTARTAYDPFDDNFILSDDENDTSFQQSQNRQVPLLSTSNPPKKQNGFFRAKSDYTDMNDSGDVFKDPNVEDSNFDIRKIYNKVRRVFPGGKKAIDDSNTNKEPRQIFIMSQSKNAAFGYFGNYISTTKYNIATFLPKFLFEQFSKYANLFFLFTSIIQQVPHVSPTNRYTTIGTLTIVLLVSAVKEVLEDFKRANADSELNNTRVLVLDPEAKEFHSKKWIQVQVGDIVKVNNEEPFPADLLLLASSEPEGLCYVETANLDGETNLKIKQSIVETNRLVDPENLVRALGQAEITSEQPNSSLYTYQGNLKTAGKVTPMTPDQLLLRGATLRNTQWIHGVTIFTGHETKLMRNATATPIKRTDVERIINLQIIALFSILITLSLISTVGNVIKTKVNSSDLSYLYLEGTSLVTLFFQDILTYWILFSNLVPISLFVTVELIKYYQAYMIGSDLDMYYEETDTPCGVRTSSLVEELGQIEYIFSDKTGTLTRNIMEYKSCSIGGKCYIEDIPEDGHPQIVDGGIEIGYHTFQELFQDLANVQLQQSAIINEFFTLLSTCHTVIPEVDDVTGTIKYQAASPDEGALVQGAADMGYKFIIRKPTLVTIENTLTQQKSDYVLLNICEFNSTRKRMSAIFRCPDGMIRLFCKGADTVILERLSQDEPQPFVDSTLRHCEEFAAEGLRTLCIASRIIPEEEYAQWEKQYNEASISMDDRAEKLDEVAELIENRLFLLGATAIEDKLQEGVPETIHTLQEAGIKIWVLTGDKQETAINIGMSCKLLAEDMNLLIINEENKQNVRLNLEEKLAAIQSHQSDADDAALDLSLALIIDGHSLTFALEPDLEDMLLQLGTRCKAVICCRVSPLQKALVVKLVKRKTKSLLLAIGDGANDVSMIQAAHVGVGISGMEGMQAARSADVSIGQFKFLKKLLLVHGAWSYRRLSNAILYSFYKNVTLYMTQFWFVFANGFSGQSIMESWTLTFYNVLFTVLPPFVLGVFDQFVSARLLDRYPQLYQLGQQRKFFNVKIFYSWILNGFFHSGVIFVCSMVIYRNMDATSDGLLVNNWAWGTAMYTTSTVTALGKAGLIVTMWTKFTVIAIPGSLVLWLCWFPAYATIAPLINVSKEFSGVLSHTYPTLTFWATIFGVSTLCLLRDVAWKYFKRSTNPETYHLVQEIQKYNIQDHRPRMELFQRAIRKVRQVQRIKKQRGFAFSQVENQNQADIVRLYDTTKKRDAYGVRDE